MKANKPSTTGSNGGRDKQGRFAKGNKCAQGNPHAKQVAQLRSALLSAVKPADIRVIVKKLIKRAKEGDIVAIKEIFDRSIGKPVEMDFLEKLENLERILDEFAKPCR
jgi:hypothetical protein